MHQNLANFDDIWAGDVSSRPLGVEFGLMGMQVGSYGRNILPMFPLVRMSPDETLKQGRNTYRDSLLW